jgi:hypothetical protein
LHSDTILSISTIKNPYPELNWNNLMDR